MLRNLLHTTTLATGLAAALVTAPLGTALAQSGEPLREIPQNVILATTIIGMPTFIKDEDVTAGPIGALADAIVGLDGTIQGVVIRTRQGRALAVPASLLEQGRVAGRPILIVNITREQAEQAPDVSGQLPQSSGAAAGEQPGVTGTTTDGTDATGADSGADGTGTQGRAGTDGQPMDNGSTDSGSMGSGSTDEGTDTTGATAGEQSGVTGTTTDGTDATGADSGADGTGTQGRAGTDGQPVNGGDDGSTTAN